jgi:hypothetical protein
MTPPFEANGLLPAGVHAADWSEFQDRFAWNEARTRQLNGLSRAALLAVAGCKYLYVDGSYVTNKEEPGDFDACWDEHGVELGVLDPVILDLSNRRAAQQARFGGALLPANMVASDSGLTILESYMRDLETGKPKGIIRLGLPHVQEPD